MEDNYNQYYKIISNKYNKIRLDSKENIDNTIKIIKEQIHGENKQLLDIGCGTGVYGSKLQENGFVVIGIDKSKEQVEQAKKLITAYCCNATELPFEEERFDIVTMIMMLHQLSNEERVKAFYEIYKVLKEGGNLIIKTASQEEIARKFNSVYFPRIREIDKERYPEIKRIHEELEKFTKIKDIHTSIKVIYDKKDMLERLRNRRTSNLWLLNEEELKSGIQLIEEKYRNSGKIECNIENTFIIATK